MIYQRGGRGIDRGALGWNFGILCTRVCCVQLDAYHLSRYLTHSTAVFMFFNTIFKNCVFISLDSLLTRLDSML